MKSTLKHYPPLRYADDLAQICSPLTLLGINYFAHVRVDKKQQFSAIGLKPTFVEHYLEKSYYNYDIHMALHTDTQAYTLWDAVDLRKQSKKLRDELSHFGLYHTFTMAQKNLDDNEYFHFATPVENHQANNHYFQQLDHLKRFILYFKDKISAHKPLASSYDIKFTLDRIQGEFSTQQSSLTLDNTQFAEQLRFSRIYLDNSTYLTPREFECLHWLSQAKTINDIARILLITPRTVKAHIANIKEKSGCHNQFQLGALHQKLKSSMHPNNQRR